MASLSRLELLAISARDAVDDWSKRAEVALLIYIESLDDDEYRAEVGRLTPQAPYDFIERWTCPLSRKRRLNNHRKVVRQ